MTPPPSYLFSLSLSDGDCNPSYSGSRGREGKAFLGYKSQASLGNLEGCRLNKNQAQDELSGAYVMHEALVSTLFTNKNLPLTPFAQSPFGPL